MKQIKQYTPYYRVSTKGQGESGLGLEAQQESVLRHVRHDNSKIKGFFLEVEKGRNNDRIELHRAIDFCKENNTTLLVARLNRLSRDAEFIFKLRNGDVPFECCDIPEANTLTIGIFATIAQHQQETISKNTKEALAALKARGAKLGSPQNFSNEGRYKGGEVRKQKALTNQNNRRAAAYIMDTKENGFTYEQIAHKLNAAGFRTATGKLFRVTTVRRLYTRNIEQVA